MAAAMDCKNQVMSDMTDDEVMKHTFEIMERRNMYGVTSGRLTEKWKKENPQRIITSLYYRFDGKDPSPDSARTLFQTGQFEILGEIAAQYEGISADDPSLAAYWTLAEEMNIPECCTFPAIE